MSSQPDIPFYTGRAFRLGPAGEISPRDGSAVHDVPVVEDSPSPRGSHEGFDFGDALETLENMKTVAGGWLARIPAHPHTNDLLKGIDDLIVMITCNLSKLEQLQADNRRSDPSLEVATITQHCAREFGSLKKLAAKFNETSDEEDEEPEKSEPPKKRRIIKKSSRK
eukprot:9477912-Pyramimonas_sp.AAC.2